MWGIRNHNKTRRDSVNIERSCKISVDVITQHLTKVQAYTFYIHVL